MEALVGPAGSRLRHSTRVLAAVALLVLLGEASSAAAAQAQVGAVQAIRLATTTVKPGRVFDLDLDSERGRLVWDVDVASRGRELEVRIDARSGRVLRVERDRTPDPEMALLAAARVPAARAVRISSAAVRGARLDGLELERERGRVVWKAELTRSGVEYDVVVDARSGQVLRRRVDD